MMTGVHLLERGLWVAQADETKGGLPSYPQPPLEPASPAWGQFPDRSPQFPVLSYAFPCSQVGKFPVRQDREMVANSLNQ